MQTTSSTQKTIDALEASELRECLFLVQNGLSLAESFALDQKTRRRFCMEISYNNMGNYPGGSPAPVRWRKRKVGKAPQPSPLLDSDLIMKMNRMKALIRLYYEGLHRAKASPAKAPRK